MMKTNFLRKRSTYLILTAVCIGILLLEFLVIFILDKMNKGENVNDDFATVVAFFICFPGIIAGIIGSIICSFKKK